MKFAVINKLILLALIAISCCKTTENVNNEPAYEHHKWLDKPPMGWNSFDAYGSRINEKEFRDHVEIIEDKLLPYGYNYAVIDYIWFNDNPGAWGNPKKRFGHPDLKLDENGVPIEKLNMDEYGRLLPSPVRFPSSADGKGFKPLADWVHSKGMKFGIHIMRGIPRQAYYEDLPILGTNGITAKDITEPEDTCNWLNNMFGIDGLKEGSQEYYNSIFNLYAEWGVDFVKADNMLYPEYHTDDLEMMRKAIDQCGRPIILSVSNGEAPLAYAEHLAATTNLWRVSGDFWDRWHEVDHMFSLMNSWSSYIGNGTFPDADMIPFGKLSLTGRPNGPERWTRLTRDEQYTLMNLWCISRSPLMLGADLYTLDDSTYTILTNKELLHINQNTTNNRQVYVKRGQRITWAADDPENGNMYVALFNLKDEPFKGLFVFEWLKMRGKYKVTNIWTGEDLGILEKDITVPLEAHASAVFRIEEVN